MQKLLFLFFLILFQSSVSTMAMAENQRVKLIRRSHSQEAIHSAEYIRLKAQQTFESKMAEVNLIHNQLQSKPVIPPAPVFKPKAKPAAPPVPQKPQSFLDTYKKQVAYGAIGIGSLALAGIAWHAATRKNQEVITYKYH